MEKKGQREVTVLQVADSECLKSLITNGNVTRVSKFLYEKGASVNSCLLMRDIFYRDPIRNFPLHLAVAVVPKYCHYDLVKYFISKGADLCAFDDRGYAPLHHAVVHKNIPATRALLEAGANVNLSTDLFHVPKNNFKCFPLHLALMFPTMRSSYIRNYQYAIGRVPQMDEEFLEGHDYFHSDAQTSLYEVVEVLLSYGANCNIVDGSGKTPLHYAVTSGDFNLTTILLDAGADINSRNGNFNLDPPIFYVLNEIMLKYLLSRNANPELLQRTGKSILHVSIERGFFYITRYLIVEVPTLLHIEEGCSVLSSAVKKCMYYHDPHFVRSFDLKTCIEEHEKNIYLLLKAGCDPASVLCDPNLISNAGGLELVKTMEDIASNPRSLQDLCIIRIRTSLQRNVTSAVKSLPLPTRLKKTLTLVGQRV